MESIELLKEQLELLEDNFKDFRNETEKRIARLEMTAKKTMKALMVKMQILTNKLAHA